MNWAITYITYSLWINKGVLLDLVNSNSIDLLSYILAFYSSRTALISFDNSLFAVDTWYLLYLYIYIFRYCFRFFVKCRRQSSIIEMCGLFLRRYLLSKLILYTSTWIPFVIRIIKIRIIHSNASMDLCEIRK